MERVVDSQICVACCSCQLVVGAPLVTQHYTSRPHMLGDKGKQGCSISLLHLHQKALSAASLNPTKHPVSTHNSATVVLSLPEFTFIDFNFNPWPANHSRMSQKVLRTNITYKVVSVHSSGTAYLQYAICIINFTVLIYGTVHAKMITRIYKCFSFESLYLPNG